MAKKLKIQVEFESVRESLSKIGAELDKAFSSKIDIFGPEQKQQAENLKKNIITALGGLDQAMSKGKVSKNMAKVFKESFEEIESESKKLGNSLIRNLKTDPLSFFTPEQLTKVKSLNDEIIELKRHLDELKKKPLAPSFQNIYKSDEFQNMPGYENIRLGQFQNIDKAENEINRRIEELQAAYDKNLKGKKGLGDERKAAQEEINLYKYLASEIQKTRAIQIATENQVQTEVLETTQKINEKIQAIDKVGQEATQSSREVAEGLKTESKNIEQNLGGMKWKEAMGLEGGLDVFGGFVEGVTGKVKGFVTGITSGVIILNTMRRIFNDTIKTIKDLDKAFNDIAIVTTYTTEEVWQMKDAFVGIANTAGMSVIEVTNIANEFFRQGRSLSETLQLTEAAGIAAKVAGIDAKKSVDYLTSAINGYKLSASQAMAVSDKFAALAAGSATDYEELAIALSKVAAQAYSAGVNMDNMMGFIAKALETTREAPENIGTAFKTIFARMSELKDYGKTLEDGMDVNRIDKALKSIGINLTDQANELRNLDEVLLDVGKKWTSLTKNQKAYVTTALAGTRQQTRLLAVFEDFDRTMELTEMSANSLGATFAQQEKYYSSIAYAQNQLTVAWQNFVSSLGSSAIFIGFFKVLAFGAGTLNDLVIGFKSFGIVLSATMILLSLAIAKTFQTAASQSAAAAGAAAHAAANFTLQGSLKSLVSNLGVSLGLLWENVKATWALVSAKLALGDPTAWAGVIAAALVGVFLIIAKVSNAATKKNKEFVESMRKSQASIFNYRKEAEDLTSLLDEYKQIDLKVNLTDADIAKQEELIRQIQDLVGEDVNIFNVEGELDFSKVETEIEGLTTKAETEFNNMAANTIATYGSIAKAYKETTDQSTKDSLILQQVLADNQGMTYDSFLKEEKSKREELKKSAMLVLELKKNSTKSAITGYQGDKKEIDDQILRSTDYYKAKGYDDGEAYIKAIQDAASHGLVTITTELVLDEEEKVKAQESLDGLLAENFSDQSILKQLQILGDFKFEEWGDDVTSTIGKIVPEVKGITTLMEKLNAESLDAAAATLAASGRTTEQIYDLNDAISGLDLVPEEQNALFKNMLESGADTFGGIQKFIDEYNIGFFEAIEITQQLKDALSEVTFENLTDSIASIRSVDENLAKVNKMISGEETYDLAFMREMIELYPEIGEAIRANTELSTESINTIMSGEKEALKTSIDNQIASLETDIANNELKISAYQDMLKVESELDKLRSEDSKALELMTLQEIEALYDQYLATKVTKASDANTLIAENNLKTQLDSGQITQDQFNKSMSLIHQHATEVAGVINSSFNNTVDQPAVETFSTKIQTAIDQLKANNQTLRDQISNLEFLKTNIDRVTTSTKAGTEASEKYKAALDEIYILTQQLSVLEQELSRLEFMEEHAKTGEEYLTSIYSQNAALKAQISVTEDLIDAQKRSQDGIYESLGNLRGSVQLINGRLVPIMSKYINLGEEQQKLIDETVESYNDLSEGIGDNSQALLENAAAIEENLQKIEDKTVEFYDILADAIKNSEKKKFEELKKGFELEKKLLDERRKMYEKAFAEEDYTDSLQEVTDERAAVISQLTELEGASDLASVTKRKELLERKAELDKTYNKTVLDYNREALLELFDEEEELIEQREADYEAAYEERINSVEWLESEILRIMGEGQDATIMYLKEHSQEYQDAWSLTKDNIEGEWLNLYDIVNTKVDEILTNIPDFSGLLEQLRQAAAYVGQINSGSGSGDYSSGGDKDKEEKTNLTKYIFQGKEYGSMSAAESAKQNAIDSAQTELNRLNALLKQQPLLRDSIVPKIQNQAMLLNALKQAKITTKAYKKGGIADFTGPAWLDGTKKRPERILSPVQTELFESMVNSLESLNSTPGNTTSNSSINIENITITTGHLNAAQDFKEAGRTLAQELKTAISERGIAINLKR